MINKQLLTPNSFSRPKKKLKSIMKIVIHYVANPNTTAIQNRNFFELRKDGNHGYGSAHFIVDDNEIIQCIPEDEMAYHVGADKYTPYGLDISSYPNARTIGVEFCHPDKEGKPTLTTYKKLLDLLTYLCDEYALNPVIDICRHYDITEKDCPKYYVYVKSEFWRLKSDVKNRLENKRRNI